MTIKQLTHVNVWVHDQDEALAFYTEKLGLELRDDVTLPELGDFRWLTVGPVGQPGHRADPPAPARAARVRRRHDRQAQ
jgi:catechol 2,3-dioxygenase-like lactoylglutathione lyase family enzyme